jgi:hypothetical protein
VNVQSIDEMWAGVYRDVPAECIEACNVCEFACLSCAEASLAEVSLAKLGRCVRLALDCAEICLATRTLVSEALLCAPRLVQAQLEICARLCAACEAECRQQGAAHDYFGVCARACARCESLCRETSLRVRNLH